VPPRSVERLGVLIANIKRVTVELDRGKLKQCATMVGRKFMCTDSEQQEGNCRVGQRENETVCHHGGLKVYVYR
jgi:hypothetical protein